MPFLIFVNGVNGALFETDILILRHEAGQLFAAMQNQPPTNLKKSDNGRYSSPSGPMTMMSGVLESP